MRPILIGLIAAFVAATILPAAASAATPTPPKPTVTAANRAQGMKEAPGVITAAGLDCTLADARFIGESTDPKTKLASKYYELACKDAEGFIVALPDKPGPPPLIYTCLEVAASGNANIACILPGNADPKQGLAAIVAKYEPGCQLSNARALGQTGDRSATVFEVACASGAGYVVNTSFPLDIAKPATFNSCLGYAANSPEHCTLTDQAGQDAYFASLVSKIGKPCTATGHRFVGSTASGTTYFEVACSDGKGYMFELKGDGSVGSAIDCAVADNIGGGCTLTNARQAQTEQADLYTRLAKAGGFDCTVNKYAPFDVNVPGHEVVELACSNRPDGAVAIFPADTTQKAVFYDCARSELVSYRCSFTPAAAAYPSLTSDLNKLGKSSCTVSGSRVIGVAPDKSGFIEVACSDGNPGFIITYDTTTMTPKAATSCPLAKSLAGGCTMPANEAHH
jgi:hypothetical protein